jgi:hypothetical protein
MYLQNFPVYVQSREAAGLDQLENRAEDYFEIPEIKRFLPFIASSRLSDRVWHEDRNAFLFVERGWSQPKEVLWLLDLG